MLYHTKQIFFTLGTSNELFKRQKKYIEYDTKVRVVVFVYTVPLVALLLFCGMVCFGCLFVA
jgi:hypothetical protein